MSDPISFSNIPVSSLSVGQPGTNDQIDVAPSEDWFQFDEIAANPAEGTFEQLDSYTSVDSMAQQILSHVLTDQHLL